MTGQDSRSLNAILREMYTEERFQLPGRTPRRKHMMDVVILVLALLSVLMFALFMVFHLRFRPMFYLSIALDFIFFADYVLRTYYSGKRFEQPWSAALARNNYNARWYGVVDAIAVIPPILAHLLHAGGLVGQFTRMSRMFRILRAARILRILRSIRIIRESEKLTRSMKRLQSYLRAEFRFASLLIFCILALGTWALYEFEGPTNPEFQSMPRIVYWSLLSLFGQQDASVIHNEYSQFIGLLIVFSGVAFLGIISGTITTFFMDKVNRHMKGKDPFRGESHVVICGWNSKAPELLGHLARIESIEHVVLLFDRGKEEEDLGGFTDYRNQAAGIRLKPHWVRGDARNSEHLKNANVLQAAKIIVLADETADLKDEQDRDARTLLITQIIGELFDEDNSAGKRKPDMTLELLSQQSVSIAMRLGVSHIVYADEIICQYMVLDVHSRSAGKVFQRLIEPEDENVYIIPVDVQSGAVAQENFLVELESHCREHRILLLGIEIGGGLFMDTLKGNPAIYDLLTRHGLLNAADAYFLRSAKRHLREWVDFSENDTRGFSVLQGSFPILNVAARADLAGAFIARCEFGPGRTVPINAVIIADTDPKRIVL